jgi:hypothetical protein
MKVARKIEAVIITVTAILTMGVMAESADVKKSPNLDISKTAVSINATISGSITLNGVAQNPTMQQKNCSDIDVKVTRVTNPWQPDQQSVILKTVKAIGGKIINGCSYSASVNKGPGTVVSASYPISLLPPQPGGPKAISGWQGPFELNADITKNIVMYLKFF